MSCNRRSKEPMSDFLPDDLMTEILCRLPIKALLQCTSVCKQWYDLIKNPNFVSTHLHKVLSSKDRPLFLHRLYEFNNDKYLLRFDNKNLGEYMVLPPPFDTQKHLHVAGSCNGVICLFRDDFSYGSGYGYKFILWNPSIRKSLLLPLPRFIFASDRRHCKNFIGFGFDSRANDYKVLRIMNPPVEDGIHFRTELYSLNSNSWKNITDIAPKYGVDEYVNPAFVNGALHWIVTSSGMNIKRRSFIMVFDVRDEAFREMLLPECLVNTSSSDLTVKVFQESSLAVIHRDMCVAYQSHVWVMMEYGKEASWVKLATVGKRWRGRSKVLGFRRSGDLLMYFARGRIASLNIKSQRVRNLITTNKSRCPSVYSYVESLALLDKYNDAGIARNTTGPSDAKRTKICN